MSTPLTMGAEVVGASFANDPELRLPQYPRFPREILVLPYQQAGLLFEGARGTQILNGRGARSFIPPLLEKLDGTRHFNELLHAFSNVHPQRVHDALALLYSRGLLEDGAAEIADPQWVHSAAFCGRYVDVTRVNRNRGEVLARLARTNVAIAATGAALDGLRDALQGQGIGAVGCLDDLRSLDSSWRLSIVVDEGNPEATQAGLSRAWQQRMPILHARITAEVVEIGPLFVPGKSACVACLRAIRPANEIAVPAADLGFWCGVVALHAFHIVSRVGNPTLYNVCHIHTRDAVGSLYEEVRIARLPGCATCGLAQCSPRLHEKHGALWLLHNAANGMPPQEWLSPRDYQMHYAATNIQITKEAPEPYYGAEHVPLPQGVQFPLAPRWSAAASPATGELTVEVLAGLLRFTVGYRADARRRVAPSAGGLGSAEAFLIVRDVANAQPGVYHYYAHDHYLERLRPTSDRVLAGALGVTEMELPPLLWVGTANLTKLRQKYNDFAFRFASLDAGVVRCYLADLCRSAGVPLVDFPQARDAVMADAISLPTLGTRNIVTHVMGLGFIQSSRTRPRTRLLDAHQYVDRLAALSGYLDPLSPTQSDADRDGRMHVLSAPPLGELLQRRSSARVFDARAISQAVMHDIAKLANAINDELTALGGLRVETKVWLAAMRPSDCHQGVYRWEPQTQQLLAFSHGVTRADIDRTMLQRALAQAPLVLFITGNFQSAVHTAGARGYRELVIRAGAIAARALLVAEASGLSGCPWGGLSEDGWGDLLHIDRYTDCPLFGVSLGYVTAND